MRRVFLILVLTAMSMPLLAQQAVPPTTPPAPAPPSIQRPGAAPGQQPSLPAPGVQAPRPAQGQGTPAPPTAPQTFGTTSWQNIKLEVAIADSLTADSSTRKSVSMIIADGRNGQVRSQGGVDGVINVDARPTVHRDGRIFLQLTMEYKPELATQQAAGNPRLTTFSESLALMLQDGVSIVASESSDPRSDRKVTVTIRASIQK